MNRFRSPFLLLAWTLAVGCAQPNVDVFHTLSPLQPEGALPAANRGPMAFEVMPIRLPEILQRPQLVQEIAPGVLRLSGSQRWGNRLDQELQRILVEDLALRLPNDAVVAFPEGARVNATHRLEVKISHFAGKPGASMALKGWYYLYPVQGGAALATHRFELERSVQGMEPEALVAAHSRLAADLSQELALELRRFGIRKTGQ